MDTTKKDTIQARSSAGSTRTALSVAHQGGRDKCTTGATSPPKIRGRDNVAIATWNVRTLAQTGKLQELTHELEKYTWHVVRLCEVRWKNHGEHLTEEGHVLYYSVEMDKHTNGIGFLVNKNIKNSVLGCRPVSSRAISIRLRAASFNISIVQAYATDHDDAAFYSQLQETIDKVDKKDILIIQGDWNAKVDKDALKDWKEFCGPSCNDMSNERGLRLLEFASYNNAVLANTLGEHKASQRWTWHAPNGIHHNQIDYILVQNRFRLGIKRATTRTFPGADVGSDHDLVFVNFKLRLKTIKKPKNTRMKFNLDRLRDPTSQSPLRQQLEGSLPHC
ncbi:craniofacial development protein 2-like [Palaemon carinicauda]|uniref:craniofacial development protein 2-like n=1 Tax=Palaemon carinicauda TaxID=392227 RepID=UPI0035B68CAF